MITRLEVSNFKSFKHISIDLKKFNVIIGSNASGKSNFVQIFQFIRDIIQDGLENAIQMQGGVEYLQNMKIKNSEPLSIKIYLTHTFGILPVKNLEGIEISDFIYEFMLKFYENDYKIIHESITLYYKIIKYKSIKPFVKDKIINEGSILIERKNEKIIVEYDKEKLLLNNLLEPVLSIYDKFKDSAIDKGFNKLLLISMPFSILLTPLDDYLRKIAIYNFDSKVIKKVSSISGKAELEEDGSNISIILRKILKSDEKRKMLFNLIKDILPFIDDINVEKIADRSLLLKIKETYFSDELLPASLLSDGTINIVTLIIALYFEEKSILIFEEPERNIHPYLISKITDYMKEASQHKQILITTHNPEFVKYANIDNLILISRDDSGFSKVYRPVDREELKEFLESDIGIDELFIHNILEV